MQRRLQPAGIRRHGRAARAVRHSARSSRRRATGLPPNATRSCRRSSGLWLINRAIWMGVAHRVAGRSPTSCSASPPRARRRARKQTEARCKAAAPIAIIATAGHAARRSFAARRAWAQTLGARALRVRLRDDAARPSSCCCCSGLLNAFGGLWSADEIAGDIVDLSGHAA